MNRRLSLPTVNAWNYVKSGILISIKYLVISKKVNPQAVDQLLQICLGRWWNLVQPSPLNHHLFHLMLLFQFSFSYKPTTTLATVIESVISDAQRRRRTIKDFTACDQIYFIIIWMDTLIGYSIPSASIKTAIPAKFIIILHIF